MSKQFLVRRLIVVEECFLVAAEDPVEAKEMVDHATPFDVGIVSVMSPSTWLTRELPADPEQRESDAAESVAFPIIEPWTDRN